jgi:hypothetical protein
VHRHRRHTGRTRCAGATRAAGPRRSRRTSADAEGPSRSCLRISNDCQPVWSDRQIKSAGLPSTASSGALRFDRGRDGIWSTNRDGECRVGTIRSTLASWAKIGPPIRVGFTRCFCSVPKSVPMQSSRSASVDCGTYCLSRH